MMAPRIGPHMRSHAIGGPACRIMRSPMPGSTSRATPMPSSTRLRRQVALGRLGVGGFDRRMVDEARERHAELAVAAGRRRPLQPRRRAAALHDRVGERAEARRSARRAAPNSALARNQADTSCSPSDGSVPACESIAAAMRATRARALLSASSTPASRSAASCRSRPCGSSSVPHTRPTNASEPLFFALMLSSRRDHLGRGIGVRAVAEHHVEQDHRHRRDRRLPRRCRSLRRRWSIIGCGRPRVNTSSPRSISVCSRTSTGRRSLVLGRPARWTTRRRALARRASLVAERAAAEEAADVALLLLELELRKLDRRTSPSRAGLRPFASATAAAAASSSVRDDVQVSARWILAVEPTKLTTTGLPRLARRGDHLARDGRGGRLGDQHDHFRVARRARALRVLAAW